MADGSAPDTGYAHRAAGWNFFRLNRFADALHEAQRALAQEPGNVDALRLRSLALSMLGRHNDAMEALAEALTLEPMSERTQIARAHILLQAKQIEPALEATSAATRLAPTSNEAHSLASEVLLRLGRNQEALAAAHEALRLDPRHVASLIRAAHAAERIGDAKAALGFARLAVAADPQCADSHRALGVAAYRAGDRTTARTALREALRLDPRNDAARADLVTTLRGSSPLHRMSFAMLRWMRRGGVRLAWVVGVMLCGIGYLYSSVIDSEPLGTVFLLAPLVLLLPMWVAPLHDFLVWRDPLGRFLLHPAERAAALFTAIALAVSAALGAAWLRTGAERWSWLALGFALYAMLGSLVRRIRSRAAAWRVAIYCAFGAGDLAAIWVVSGRSPADATLLILLFPSLWMSAFTARRWLLAQPVVKRR